MKRRHYAKRRDLNEPEIVEALKAIGATVFRLDQPADLLVGFGGINVLIEVKNPEPNNRGKPATLKLTSDEQKFHDTWTGQVAIVTTPGGACALVWALASKDDPEATLEPKSSTEPLRAAEGKGDV